MFRENRMYERPHRVHRPSRVLLQTLCMANRFLHLLVCFGEGQIRECLAFSAQRVGQGFSVPRVGVGLEVLHSWCQYDDAVARSLPSDEGSRHNHNRIRRHTGNGKRAPIPARNNPSSVTPKVTPASLQRPIPSINY